MTFSLHLLLTAASMLLLQVEKGKGESLVFHRETTGVAFSPYVHSKEPEAEKGWIGDWTNYTLQDMEIMMKVISGRFSKVATFGVGAGADRNPYEPNYTYNHSYSPVFSGEAAALVNLEMTYKDRGFEPIGIYIGIWLHSHYMQLEMEVKLAKQSVSKANSIYRDTVQGVVISHNNLASDLKLVKNVSAIVNGFKRENDGVLGHEIKLGTRQTCEGFGQADVANPSELTATRMEVIKHTDFIICEVYPNTAFGVESGFAGVKNNLNDYKRDLKAINPRIEVMGQTGWAGQIDHKHEMDDMQEYWQKADTWAAENNFTLWMLEAIDNPWKPDKGAHYGWWKLRNDLQTGDLEGYVEKVTGPKGGAEVGGGNNTTTTEPPKTTPKPTKKSVKQDSRTGGTGKEYCSGISVILGILVIISLNMIL